MRPFRWKNCYADVAASRYGITIQSFLDDVILPAIQVLEENIAQLGRSNDPSDAFAQADMEDVLRETKIAFCLSVQSIWERQLRRYLCGCAEELRPGEGLSARVAKANWGGLCALFLDLRGIQLETFPSYPDINTLQHLGNACRHGDGASAVELARRCADLWPIDTPRPGAVQPPASGAPPVAKMNIPMIRLQALVGAVAASWRDAEYIYNESIERKRPSLEARLAHERIEPSWRPQAPSTEST